MRNFFKSADMFFDVGIDINDLVVTESRDSIAIGFAYACQVEIAKGPSWREVRAERRSPGSDVLLGAKALFSDLLPTSLTTDGGTCREVTPSPEEEASDA
jgi:hypothetical protein